MPAKTGPKLIEVDWDLAVSCATAHCTRPEIAAVLNVSIHTLERRVKEEFKLTLTDWLAANREKGKAAIRVAQYRLAAAGNERMLVWLGRQWLGQREQLDIETRSHVRVEITMPDNQRINRAAKPLPKGQRRIKTGVKTGGGSLATKQEEADYAEYVARHS